MLEDKETKPANKMPLYCSSNSWENACRTPMPHSWEAVLPGARQNNTVTNKILNADEGFRGACCLLYLMLGLNCPRTAKPLPGGYATESRCSHNQRIRGCDLSLAFPASQNAAGCNFPSLPALRKSSSQNLPGHHTQERKTKQALQPQT